MMKKCLLSSIMGHQFFFEIKSVVIGTIKYPWVNINKSFNFILLSFSVDP